MPRGKQTSGGKNSLPPFISCNLTDDELAAIRKNIFEDAGVVGFVVQVSELGYRLSVSFDSFNDCYSVVITSKGDDNGKGAAALSSRGPTLYDACTVASFKLNEKLDCDVSSGATASAKSQWS